MRTTFHLTSRDHWEAQRSQSTFVPESFAAEGFIHCTNGEANLIAVGNRYYASDRREMVCLVIDHDGVTAEIRYEDPERIFPHIHGPLNAGAVCEVRSVVRHPGGTFARIGDPVPE